MSGQVRVRATLTGLTAENEKAIGERQQMSGFENID
jgi:hypothetical protein